MSEAASGRFLNLLCDPFGTRSIHNSLILHNYPKFTAGLVKLQVVDGVCFVGEKEVVRGAGPRIVCVCFSNS